MEDSGKKGTHIYLHLMFSIFGAIALSILFFFLLFWGKQILTGLRLVLNTVQPFIYGAVIAYLLLPLCRSLEGKLSKCFTRFRKGAGMARGLSVFLSLFLGALVIFALLIMVIPQLINSIIAVIIALPDSFNAFEEWLLKYLDHYEVISGYVEDVTEQISTSLPNWLANTVLPMLQQLMGGFSVGVGNVIAVFSNFFIGIIVSIYLLGGRQKFSRQAKMIVECILPEKWANLFLEEVRYTDRMFSGFINGRLLDSLIIGVLCFVGLLCLRMPYALLISVIVGVTNIIPFFGPFIGAVPSALLLLVTNPIKCFIFLIFIVVLQQFDGNILGPRIMGNTTGLSSFWVLFSILLFGGVFGFWGMIIGVPLFAVLYDIIRKLVHWGLDRRHRTASEDLLQTSAEATVSVSDQSTDQRADQGVDQSTD